MNMRNPGNSRSLTQAQSVAITAQLKLTFISSKLTVKHQPHLKIAAIH